MLKALKQAAKQVWSKRNRQLSKELVLNCIVRPFYTSKKKKIKTEKIWCRTREMHPALQLVHLLYISVTKSIQSNWNVKFVVQIIREQVKQCLQLSIKCAGGSAFQPLVLGIMLKLMKLWWQKSMSGNSDPKHTWIGKRTIPCILSHGSASKEPRPAF